MPRSVYEGRPGSLTITCACQKDRVCLLQAWEPAWSLSSLFRAAAYVASPADDSHSRKLSILWNFPLDNAPSSTVDNRCWLLSLRRLKDDPPVYEVSRCKGVIEQGRFRRYGPLISDESKVSTPKSSLRPCKARERLLAVKQEDLEEYLERQRYRSRDEAPTGE